jgi:indolepyruvate ferredoxin oxidoreductase
MTSRSERSPEDGRRVNTYQSASYATSFVGAVDAVARALFASGVANTEDLLSAYIAGAFKFRAYKDEYEVARLHRDPVEQAKIEREFGQGAKTAVLLHPPILKSLGMKRKLELGSLARPTFGVLSAMRRLRGTAVDPFGYTAMRRAERALIDRYDRLVLDAVAQLRPENVATVAAILSLADEVRGYEDVKLANIARFDEYASDLRIALEASSVPTPA